MRLILIMGYLLLCLTSWSQTNSNQVMFSTIMNGVPIELNKSYYLKLLKDSVIITNLKFYISNLELYDNQMLKLKYEKKYILIDVEKPDTYIINYDGNFNRIKFQLGIDSLVNVSGAFGGDLDPTNGMYWTWQSGYINFKLEGVSKSCKTRNNIFQFHLGGYQQPYKTLIQMDVTYKKNEVIHIDVSSFLEKINLTELNEIMSPCDNAVKLSGILSKSIFVK